MGEVSIHDSQINTSSRDIQFVIRYTLTQIWRGLSTSSHSTACGVRKFFVSFTHAVVASRRGAKNDGPIHMYFLGSNKSNINQNLPTNMCDPHDSYAVFPAVMHCLYLFNIALLLCKRYTHTHTPMARKYRIRIGVLSKKSMTRKKLFGPRYI